MAGKWQRRIVTALIEQSPQRFTDLCTVCGTINRSERTALKRTLSQLTEQGVLVRRRRGLYGLRLDASTLLAPSDPRLALLHQIAADVRTLLTMARQAHAPVHAQHRKVPA